MTEQARDPRPVRIMPSWVPYSSRPLRALVQLISDVAAGALIWVSVRVGFWVHDRVLDAAGVGYSMGHSVSGAAGQIGGAGRAADSVPMIGSVLSAPFGKAASALGELADQGTRSGDAVAWWAWPLGIVVIAVPVLLFLPWWAMLRLRFVTRASTTRRAWTSVGGVEILAAKAVVRLSARKLSRLGPNLVGRWRQGDTEAIAQLAVAYLKGV